MKDRSGNELAVGDTVAYASNFSGYAVPLVGKVTKVGHADVDIEQTSPTWGCNSLPNSTSRSGTSVIKVS